MNSSLLIMFHAKIFIEIFINTIVFVNRKLRYNRANTIKLIKFLSQRFPKLRIVHLESNELRRIPRELLELTGLTYLNLSDNKIEKIPADISQLIKYVESILSDLKQETDCVHAICFFGKQLYRTI